MDKRRLDRRINPWRYYFVNRRVANLAGFYVALLAAVLATSSYLSQFLSYSIVMTLHAAFILWVSYYFWTRYLSRLPVRDYLAAAKKS